MKNEKVLVDNDMVINEDREMGLEREEFSIID